MFAEEMTAMSIGRAVVNDPIVISSLVTKGVFVVSAFAGYGHALVMDDKGGLLSSGYNDRYTR